MVYCSVCDCGVHGGLDGFSRHIKESHHVGPYICMEGNCLASGRSYHVKSSFFRHLRNHHEDSCEESSRSSPNPSSRSRSRSRSRSTSPDARISVQGSIHNPAQADPAVSTHLVSDNVEREVDSDSDEDNEMEVDSDDSDEDDQSDFSAKLEKSAALLVLNLKRRGNVPGVAVSLVMEEAYQLMTDVVSATVDTIIKNMRESGLEEEVIDKCVSDVAFEDPFRRLKTTEKQLDFFHQNFNLVKPEPKNLGWRWDDRFNKQAGLVLPVQLQTHFQYISLIKTLTVVLNIPVFYDLIHSEKASSDGHLRSYLDGSLGRSHGLIRKYPHTIRIVKWLDDSQVVNPCGSKTEIHKIVNDCFHIQNLPPAENARLRSIHLSSYSYREDLPEDRGVDALLEPFYREMEQLESDEGVPITVNNEPYVLRATVIGFSADALEAHELVGLASPSADRFCSQCLISRKEFHRNIFAMGLKRSKDVHQRNVEELCNRGKKFAMQSSGIVRESILFKESKYAEFPEAVILDAMHDILRGIAPMEIKLVLHEICIVKKYIDVTEFNACLKSFNYGPGDVKNKPSPNFTVDSLTKPFSYVLHQTAAQAWCLIRIFPFIVMSKVPEDYPHVKLIVLLKRMCDVILSTDISESDLTLLENLICEHHHLFVQLYPLPLPKDAQTSTSVNQEGGEEEDFEEDFLQDSEEEEPEATTSSQAQAASAGPSSTPGSKKKRVMVVRPIQKHHHLLHYSDLLQRYGPIVLYWCMRFEAKNALTKRFGSLCNNFQNLPLTFANLHQISHAADLWEVGCAVKDEVSHPRGQALVVSKVEDLNVLLDLGVKEDDVVCQVSEATVGGFRIAVGLYVTLPLVIDGAPLFGKIRHIYVLEGKVFVTTQDVKTVNYDQRFGAYLIEDILPNEDIIRAFQTSNLPPTRPMTPWTADHISYYLSPRNSVADSMISLNISVDD